MHFGAVMLYESPKWLFDCVIFGSGSRRLRHSHQITTNNKAKVLVADCLIRRTIIVPLSNPASRIHLFEPPGWVVEAYFLGLLAKIKCSICSYDCEKSYGRHCLPDFHNNISSQGLRVRNLLQPFPTVFLALHSSLVTLTLYWVPKNLNSFLPP